MVGMVFLTTCFHIIMRSINISLSFDTLYFRLQSVCIFSRVLFICVQFPFLVLFPWWQAILNSLFCFCHMYIIIITLNFVVFQLYLPYFLPLDFGSFMYMCQTKQVAYALVVKVVILILSHHLCFYLHNLWL